MKKRFEICVNPKFKQRIQMYNLFMYLKKIAMIIFIQNKYYLYKYL